MISESGKLVNQSVRAEGISTHILYQKLNGEFDTKKKKRTPQS